MLPLYDRLLFRTYDLAAVRLSALRPPGGPVGEASAVTVFGTGFATYGQGQVVCRVDGEHLPGVFISAQEILCPVPPSPFEKVSEIAVSLNNGADGTFVSDRLSFTAYKAPVLFSVTPTEGPASGGTVVVVTGSGFATFGSARVRCCFGTVCAATPPISLNDSVVECNSTWGTHEFDGSAVTVTLNGGWYPWRGLPWMIPRFYYFGNRPPALVDAYFSPGATTIVVQFDAQPTNRGALMAAPQAAAL